MTIIERYPNITIGEMQNDANRTIGDVLVHLEHRMKAIFPEVGIEKIGYVSEPTELRLVALEPHASPKHTSIRFMQNSLVEPENFEILVKEVSKVIPNIIKANVKGFEREKILGNTIDEHGNIVTEARHWKVDPIFMSIARSLGLNPHDPIRLTPSVFEADPLFGRQIAMRQANGIILKGFVLDDDNLEICFEFTKGNLKRISLYPKGMDIHMNENIPESVIPSLIGEAASKFVEIKGSEADLTKRTIVGINNDPGGCEIYVNVAEYVNISE